jgi:hypothetical protein
VFSVSLSPASLSLHLSFGVNGERAVGKELQKAVKGLQFLTLPHLRFFHRYFDRDDDTQASERNF